MRFGNREPRSLVARWRGRFRPKGERLEGRVLLAFDVGGSTPPNNPNMATVPYGVIEAGGVASGGAGFSVTNVGDINGDGFDDFVVGAPTVVNNGGVLSPGAGNTQATYLIFGSRTTNAGAIQNWLTNTADQRVGDLSQLGNSANGQQNPITGNPGYPFAGIRFVTSQEPGSQLGASVAAAGVINGTPAFLIGAPGGTDSLGANPGTGRAYLIYGGPALNSVNSTTVDLDNPAQNSGVTFVTFTSSNTPGAHIGRSVAGVGDVITNGFNDIAIGAPNTTSNGLGNSGAVYLVDGTGIPTGTTTVNLATIGQTGGRPGVIFTGNASGDLAGWSVAGAGDVDGGITSANQRIQDLLIGAPQTGTGAGIAYLIYGATNLASNATVVGGVNQIQLARIGSSNTTTTVRGLTMFGVATGDETGFAVASAGDFDGNGLSDILIGSPGFRQSSGRVDILYGAPVSGAPLQGVVTLTQLPASIENASLVGGTPGDLAGWSISLIGKISATTAGNPFVLGAPGFNGGSGTVYLIPPNLDLEGSFSLASATAQPVAATQFTLTTPGTPGPAFFGASVSGRLTQTTQAFTADADKVADFVVGAAGYAATTARSLAGGAFIFEGALIASLVQTPTSTGITTQIGVEKAFGPFTNINPTTPATMQIFVFSNAAQNFAPVTDIDPTTTVVNGVAFPTATVTKDPVDENKDGIPDAIVTIQPRSNLGLTASTTTLTITGRTLTTSPIGNRRWSGTAAITVAGGGGGGGGTGTGAAPAFPVGFIAATSFIAPFGPDTYVPSILDLSRLGSYKPIPLSVAMNQFLPEHGFAFRIQQFFHPKKYLNQFGYNGGNGHNGHRTLELGTQVFTREKYKPGRVFNFTHPTPVVPSNLQTERLASNGVSFHPAPKAKKH
jgi:hypothetical protein